MASMLYQHLPDVVGVVGAGQMGTGIAQVLAQKGLKVILSDRKFDIIERGLSVIQRSLDKQAKSGRITGEEAAAAVGRIETAVSLEPFRKADFVIEAAPEDEEVKKAIFRKLDQVTAVHTILASNTSSISITRLAAVTSKPHRVVGMHFMHPVVTVPMVELAKGMHTSHATFESTVSLCQRLGKTVCVSQDRPGFILYRVLMPMINEAFFCMMEGVGTPEDIDRGMRLGTNAALGPLKLADAIGLDTCLSIMKVLQQQFGDSKYRPCPLLAQYVDGGWLGVKTGRGVFYYTSSTADKTVEKRVAGPYAAQYEPGFHTFASSPLLGQTSRPEIMVDPASELTAHQHNNTTSAAVAAAAAAAAGQGLPGGLLGVHPDPPFPLMGAFGAATENRPQPPVDARAGAAAGQLSGEGGAPGAAAATQLPGAAVQAARDSDGGSGSDSEDLGEYEREGERLSPPDWVPSLDSPGVAQVEHPPQTPDHPLGSIYGPSAAGRDGPAAHVGVVHDAPGMSCGATPGGVVNEARSATGPWVRPEV